MPTLVIDRKKTNYSLCKVSRKRAASQSADIAVWSLIGRCLSDGGDGGGGGGDGGGGGGGGSGGGDGAGMNGN